MSNPQPNTDRHSNAVWSSFVITAVTAFAIVGYSVGLWLVGVIFPDAADFYRRGGIIETVHLRVFYCTWTLVAVVAAIVGAFVGNGFYIAWHRR